MIIMNASAPNAGIVRSRLPNTTATVDDVKSIKMYDGHVRRSFSSAARCSIVRASSAPFSLADLSAYRVSISAYAEGGGVRVRPTLIDALLSEQRDLTAVERFARWHEANDASVATTYRHLVPLEKPRPGEQYAFEVDLDKCSGCKSCVAACHSLNGLDEDETWRSVGLLISATKSEIREPKPDRNPTSERRRPVGTGRRVKELIRSTLERRGLDHRANHHHDTDEAGHGSGGAGQSHG